MVDAQAGADFTDGITLVVLPVMVTPRMTAVTDHSDASKICFTLVVGNPTYGAISLAVIGVSA